MQCFQGREAVSGELRIAFQALQSGGCRCERWPGWMVCQRVVRMMTMIDRGGGNDDDTFFDASG